MDARLEAMKQATQDLIVAIQASMNATKKCMDMQTDAGLMTENKYKNFMNQLNEQRIQLLELTGEIPERKKPKSKYDAFGCRLKK